jgi:transcriptional regulator with XRE-family HTH domain
MPSTFGENLEKLLKEKRLTQKELARSIGCSPKTVQEWVGKNGRIPRTTDHIRRLAEVFQISVFYLLYGEDDPFATLMTPSMDAASLAAGLVVRNEITEGVYEVTVRRIKAKAEAELSRA